MEYLAIKVIVKGFVNRPVISDKEKHSLPEIKKNTGNGS